jgi:hypothetical protein
MAVLAISSGAERYKSSQKEDFTMNILPKSGYKPLTRITNLGWQKAEIKSRFSPLSFCPKSTPK